MSELRNINLFHGLKPSTLEKLLTICDIVHFGNNQLIMMEGDLAGSVFFILKGIVRVYRTSPAGREQTLITLQQGDSFNLPSAFSKDGLAHASASAIGNVTLLRIAQKDFRCVVAVHGDLALAVLENVSEKLIHLTELVHDVSLRSVRGRLARFLMDQVEKPTTISWTQEEIAAQIGTSREVVSRSLRELIQNGMVKRERQRIFITDPVKLRAEAEA